MCTQITCKRGWQPSSRGITIFEYYGVFGSHPVGFLHFVWYLVAHALFANGHIKIFTTLEMSHPLIVNINLCVIV